MDRTEAREQLKGYLQHYVESVTKPSKGKGMYVCPLCGSGSGRNGTGAFSIKDGESWKCFACNTGGDIFDLYGLINNTQDHNRQLTELCDQYNITLDPYSPGNAEQRKTTTTDRNTHMNIHTNTYTQTDTQERVVDFTEFFLQANSHIGETDYWKKRGLSKETVDRFKLGYVAEWRHPKAPPTVAPTPRLIIPVSQYSYIARDTRANIPPEQESYKKTKVKGKDKVLWTFNRKAILNAVKPIFVVEGEMDALSIIEVGGEAVALGSVSNVRAFLELVKAEKPTQPLIIALDNDEAGKKANETLAEGLQKLQIPFYRANPSGEHKDANEALQSNREAFKRAVDGAAETAQNEATSNQDQVDYIQEETEQAQKEEYARTSTFHFLQGFVDGITASVNTPFIPTGFKKLDAELDGGLYEGLYIVGAISSLGKTTLVTQITDQIAQSGNDVLIFSLEMARAEIMAKSISRHTAQQVLETGGDMRNAKSARGITTGARYEKYSDTELKLITDSISTYSKYADHVYISEGMGDIGVEHIRATVQKHVRYTGQTPVVVVDYLQILAPYSERLDSKQNTDKSVLELKRISRDFKTPVISISSFNRENYKTTVSMLAFKESGAIEYGADVLVGLQLKGTGTDKFNEAEAKRKDPREVELIILKNRNGRTGGKIGFQYYPMFNYFRET